MSVVNRTLVCGLALFAGFGCKGKPTHREAPANAESGSGSARTTANTDSHTLVLPRGDGTPPKRTKGPLSDEMKTKLRALTFPGFEAAPQNTRADTVVVDFHTGDRPKLKATVQIQPCDSACIPLELPRWEHLDQLKDLLHADLRAAKDTTFEVGANELNGTTMIDTYQVGMATTDAGTRYSDTYVLYYNDGSNKIRVVGMYADNKPDTREQMLKLAPKEDLEHLAKAFMDAYTQAWAD